MHTNCKPLKRVRFSQKIERVQVQVIEQMLRVGRGDDHRRVLLQSIQKRVRNGIVGVGEPEKDQRTIGRLHTGEHVLRKGTGLTKTEPAGALKVVSKLRSARPRLVKAEVRRQCG